MDNSRPELDLRHLEIICQDKKGTSSCNVYERKSTWKFLQVPVIAVFTKYDQFKIDIEITPEDPHRNQAEVDAEVNRIFKEHYLDNLRRSSPFVRLESEGSVNQLACATLIFVP